MKGIISKTIDWITHPYYADGKLGDWAAFLVLVAVVSFLWTTTVEQTVD